MKAPHAVTDSVVIHISITLGFKSLPRYVGMVFHLSCRLIIIGCPSVHLPCSVYKRGRKTAIYFKNK